MNILSIDLDVCFECEQYAKYMWHDVDPEVAWNALYGASDALKLNLEPNKEVVNKIIKVLSQKASKARIRVVEEHDGIMKYLPSQKNNVYNMDHHHDLTYGSDDVECNLENWVRHANNRGMIDKYYWINRTMSEPPAYSPFQHYTDNILEAQIDMMPEFDLVVFSISKHFTPLRHWDSLLEIFLSYCNEMKHFREIPVGFAELLPLRGYEDYMLSDEFNPIRLFSTDDGLYCILEEEDENTVAVSIYNAGVGSLFRGKEVIDYLLKDYKYLEFNFKPGIRNEVYISRIANQYDVVEVREGFYRITKEVE